MSLKRIFILFLIFVIVLNAEDLADRIKQYNAKQITMTTAQEMNIVISEDGQSILFSSNMNGNYDIFRKDLISEETTQITEAPGNEYPQFIYDDDLYFISDATDIYGNIYLRDLKGKNEEIIYLNKGEEKNPVINEKAIIFSKKTDKYRFYSFDIKKKKVQLIKGAEGRRIVFSSDGKQAVFVSNKDESGYNILYKCSYEKGLFKDVEQISFGAMIINGVDISTDGSTVVYSAIKSDTDNNGVMNINDNSVLYKISFNGNGTVQFQLTPENYSSKAPKISSSDNIYFISDRSGNDDVWMCNIDGVIPKEENYMSQRSVADFLFQEFNAKKVLNEGSSINLKEENELLDKSLLSYNRILSLFSADKDKLLEVYYKMAEIYEIQKQFEKAESIYRLIQSRYIDDKKVSEKANFFKKLTELKRKGIRTDSYGFELEEHINNLKEMTVNCEDEILVQSIYISIGKIYFDLGQYSTANNYFISARGKGNSESYYWQAKTALVSGNSKSAGSFLEKAIESTSSNDLKEKYIREYFTSGEDLEGRTKKIRSVLSNKDLPSEIRSYGNLILGDMLDNIELKLEYYNVVKQFYVDDPENILKKKFSAAADLKLARLYTDNRMNTEAEGVYKYSIDNYSGIDYDFYTINAVKDLSNLYLNQADEYLKAGKNENALLIYYKAFDLDRENIVTLRGMADSYNSLGKIDEIIRFFTVEYEKDVNSSFMNYALGYAYSLKAISSKEYLSPLINLSINLIERSLELESNNKYAYLTLSYDYEALFHLRNIQEDEIKKQNILLKGVNYIVGPVKFLLSTINLLEDDNVDYLDKTINTLNKGLAISNIISDRDLYLKMTLNLANNYYNLGEFGRKNALEKYQVILDNDFKFTSLQQKAIIYEKIGHCHFTLGNDEAEEYYEKAIGLYRSLNDRESEIRVSMRNALYYLSMKDKEGDFIGGSDASEKYNDIVVKLKSEGKDDIVRLLQRNSAFAQFIDDEYGKSADILHDLLAEYNKDDLSSESEGNYIILTLLGLDIPVWQLNISLGSMYPEGFNSDSEIAFLYSLQASNYFKLKDFFTVEEFLNKKLAYFEGKNNRLAVSLVQNRLGMLYYYKGDYSKSISHFKNSNEICIDLELYNVIITNKNNILKALARIKKIDSRLIEKYNIAISDTSTNSFPKGIIEKYPKAVNQNIKGVLKYRISRYLSNSISPADQYKSLTYLLSSEEYFSSGIAMLKEKKKLNKDEKVLLSSMLYNRAVINIETDDRVSAKQYMDEGIKLAEESGDRLILWRFYMKSGDLSDNDPIEFYLKAERTLSEYLPSTDDYEMITSWQDDIRPLYDRIIKYYISKKQISQALNYSERYKKKMMLDYYSSRYLSYKEQLHKIHITKIRYNTTEIIRYNSEIDRLKNKDSEKYAEKISDYEGKADRYTKELKDIYSQIKNDNDNRLLQFVSIDDIAFDDIDEILDEDNVIISFYSFEDQTCIFLRNDLSTSCKIVKKDNELLNSLKDYFNGNPDKDIYLKIYDHYIRPFEKEISGKDHVYIVPDFDETVMLPFVTSVNMTNKEIEPSFSKLPTISSLGMIDENKNINYSELKNISEIKEISEVKNLFENGGFIYLDKYLNIGSKNSLENYFNVGKDNLKVSEFLKYKIPAYGVLLKGFDKFPEPSDYFMLVNSLIYSGAQSIILPMAKTSGNGIDSLVINSFKKLDEYDLDEVLASCKSAGSCGDLEIFGSIGMNAREQTNFASDNLQNLVVNGIRNYKSTVYEKASSYFAQALLMARKIKDKKQELNILGTIISSYSNFNDFKNAIKYGKELLVFAEQNNLEEQIIKAYDSISKDYFRSADYDSSASYQNKILDYISENDIKQKLKSYNMLSSIYARKGHFEKSISYQKKYLETGRLISSGELDSLSSSLNVRSSEVLFNSLKSILVNYYKAEKIDSALSVYNIVKSNSEIFKSIPGSSMADLFESVGLCYFKKSFYGNAEEFYKKSLSMVESNSEKASLYQNLADLYYKSDKLSLSLKMLSNADMLLSDSDNAGKMKINNTRSLIEVKLGNIPSALTYSYNSLERSIESKNKFEESIARVNLAKILIMANEIDKAEINLKLSSQLATETNNKSALISSEFYKGMILSEHKLKFDEALNKFENSLKLSQEGSDKFFEARSLYQIGMIYYDKQNTENSYYYLDQCSQLAEKYDINDIYYMSERNIAELKFKNGSLDLQRLNKVISKIEDDILFRSESPLNVSLMMIVERIYDIAVAELFKRGDISSALTMIQEKDHISAQNDINYFSYERHNTVFKIKDNIRKLYSEKISLRLQDKPYSQVEGLISAEKQKYESSVKNTVYDYKNNIYMLSQLQKGLGNEDVILVFAPFDEDLNIIVISNKISTVQKGKLKDTYTENILDRIENRSDLKEQAKLAYNDIFSAPVLNMIQDKKDLFIYSSGSLKNFPFDLLFDGQKHLIEKYNISEINTISPVKVEDFQFAKSISFVNPFSSASELVYADREYESLQWENKSSNSLIQKNATEINLYNTFKDDYSLYHFPNHTYSLSKDSMNVSGMTSYIQLSADSKNDGKYSWNEILNKSYTDKDIILSGCDSGGKMGFDHSAYFDIAGAFEISGAKSVVSSRWKTDDLGAAVLMKRYFRYLGNGSSRIEALSNAKRDVIKYFNDYPYYWAGFKLSGRVF
ncbi:MAG: CHAT domain-containing protein [Candidatus Delongbacteria bacterium]|nr:CHAT domain-containing protein [Candidatus Delongbacteria bacterium]